MPFRTYLTQADIDQAADPATPQYLGVSAGQIFGKNADPALALRIYNKNRKRYLALKEEWRYICGEKKRPDSQLDSL